MFCRLPYRYMIYDTEEEHLRNKKQKKAVVTGEYESIGNIRSIR